MFIIFTLHTLRHKAVTLKDQVIPVLPYLGPGHFSHHQSPQHHGETSSQKPPKRPVPESRIEQIVTGLVRQLEATGETEVPSARIGELAMDGLREVDTVGYVRFASVYRDFTEGRDFSEILTSMDSLEPDSQEKTGPRGIKKP